MQVQQPMLPAISVANWSMALVAMMLSSSMMVLTAGPSQGLANASSHLACSTCALFWLLCVPVHLVWANCKALSTGNMCMYLQQLPRTVVDAWHQGTLLPVWALSVSSGHIYEWSVVCLRWMRIVNLGQARGGLASCIRLGPTRAPFHIAWRPEHRQPVLLIHILVQMYTILWATVVVLLRPKLVWYISCDAPWPSDGCSSILPATSFVPQRRVSEYFILDTASPFQCYSRLPFSCFKTLSSNSYSH